MDSFNLYSKRKDFQSVILQNYNYSKIKGKNSNNLLVNNDNEIVNFDTLLTKKKKIVIIDFWASWCAPCVRELSTINNLISELGDTEVSYLFISMDEDISKWKNAITAYSFMNNKNSFILKDDFESNLAKSHSIKSIPFYCIFRNDGTLIKDGIENIQTPEFKTLITKQLLKK